MTTKTTGGQAIESAVRSANARGAPAIAGFLTGGYPNHDRFPPILEAVARTADVVEIGVPFTDPMADGITIQRSSHVALENGTTMGWIFDQVQKLQTATPCILMSYVNPLLGFGLEELGKACADAGVHGIIVPDLPIEECEDIQRHLASSGVALIQLVSPATPARRLRRISQASEGFVYAVTTRGTTGGAVTSDDEMLAYLDRVREQSPVPVMAGFGIRTPEQVSAIGSHADGVIVGSALIDAIDGGNDPSELILRLRGREEAVT